MVFIIQLKPHNTYNNEQFIFVDLYLYFWLCQILTMSNWLKKDLGQRKLIVNYYWFNNFLIVLAYRYFFWKRASGSQKQSKLLLKILILKLEGKLRLYSEHCLLNRFFFSWKQYWHRVRVIEWILDGRLLANTTFRGDEPKNYLFTLYLLSETLCFEVM